MPTDVPNANWLRPCYPSAGQQRFGDALLAAHPFVLIPSAVSTHSWNILFDPAVATGLYTAGIQEDFALDTRLHRARP
jgi:RES domain-containing protein